MEKGEEEEGGMREKEEKMKGRRKEGKEKREKEEGGMQGKGCEKKKKEKKG